MCLSSEQQEWLSREPCGFYVCCCAHVCLWLVPVAVGLCFQTSYTSLLTQSQGRLFNRGASETEALPSGQRVARMGLGAVCLVFHVSRTVSGGFSAHSSPLWSLQLILKRIQLFMLRLKRVWLTVTAATWGFPLQREGRCITENPRRLEDVNQLPSYNVVYRITALHRHGVVWCECCLEVELFKESNSPTVCSVEVQYCALRWSIKHRVYILWPHFDNSSGQTFVLINWY